MNVTDDQDQVIHELFDDTLTPDQIEAFKDSFSVTGITADGLEKIFAGVMRISKNDADDSSGLARRLELAASEYAKRMQSMGRVPAGAAAMARQAEACFTAAREATCSVPCDSIEQRVWRLSAARDAMEQLYQQLGTRRCH